jgi:hypothetical protein
MVTFRGHTGMLFVMRFWSVSGPFCRDCGIATFRRVVSTTLVTGWWGILSFFITPFVLLADVIRRREVKRLAPPNPIAGHRPVSPGRPLFKRWQTLGLLVPVVVVIVALFVAMAPSPAADPPADPAIGSCVHSDDQGNADVVSCGSSHDGVIVDVVAVDSDCPDSTSYTLYDPDLVATTPILCVAPDH